MGRFTDRPRSTWLRRAIFHIHLWTGLAIGVYVVVVCVSGAALVFRLELQQFVHPHLFTPTVQGPLAEPADVMRRAQAAHPALRLSGVEAPTADRQTYLAYVGGDEDFVTLLLDPVTAEPLGTLPDRSIVRTVQALHFELLSGPTGRTVNGIGALLLLTMCGTGLVIWWPGRAGWGRGLTVDFRRPWRRVTWDLHSAVGIWGVAFIAVWATTGFYFAFPSTFRNLVNAISPLSVLETPHSDPAGASEPLSWEALVERSRHEAPGQFVARVVVPTTRRDPFLVMFAEESPTRAGGTALTSVYLDQFSGERLATPRRRPSSIGDLVMDWAAPLHLGNFSGLAVKLLWSAMALAPAVLFATGGVMWWTRVLRPRAPSRVPFSDTGKSRLPN